MTCIIFLITRALNKSITYSHNYLGKVYIILLLPSSSTSWSLITTSLILSLSASPEMKIIYCSLQTAAGFTFVVIINITFLGF